MSDKQRTAIVTGAAGGIGRALVKGLLDSGIRVAAVDRTRDGLNVLAAAAREQGRDTSLLTIEADLSRDGAISDIVGQARGRFGAIDILVNNAGVGQATLRRAIGSSRCASGTSPPISGASSSRCTRRRRCCWRKPSSRR
jgi:NAD(P)-dependent dehydrogenase (short-subunit alcohol dehydrogenase family)